MTRRSISEENGEPEARLLQKILKDPASTARQIAADNQLIASLSAAEIDLAGLQQALDAGANPDRVVWNGHPALHVAVARRSADAIAMLLKYDVSVEDVNQNQATALDEAKRLNFREGAALLEQARAVVNIYSPDGASPHYTSYQSRINQELVQCAANRKRPPREMEAALALGAQVNMGAGAPLPLFLALAACSEEKVGILLDAGAPVCPADKSEGTALAQLWHAKDREILSPEWRRLYDKILRLGGGDVFSRPLDDYTLEDLRQPLGLPMMFGRCNVMHHLVRAGHTDFVLEAIARDPSQKIKAEDLLKTSSFSGVSVALISDINEQNRVDDFLSPRVWQGRVEDLAHFIRQLESFHTAPNVIDFDGHLAANTAFRQQQLAQQAKKSAPRFKGS